MKHRNAKVLDRPKMGRRNPGNAPLKLSARDEQVLRYGRGGQADDTRWLPEAATGAMQAVGTDRIARAAFGLAAKALGRAAPVFRSAPANTGGVHVPRSAAAAKDAEALALYDRLLDGERFGSLPREAQLDIARRTGWQELPTGETVRQIPRFEFGPGWRRYEPFATETRAVLSGVAENEVGAVPPMTMAEAFAGDGAKEFFRRYPNAKNWLVRADRAPAPRVMGFSEPGSTAVTVTDEGLMRGAEPVLNTVHHETQHVIQNMSGMSPGSTSADALAELKAGIGNALLDGRGSDPAVTRAVDALQQAMKSSDPAYHAYQHAGGEAGAFAAGNAAVEGRTGELITDAMSREGIMPENVYDLRALRQDAKGGEDRFSMSRNFLATDEVPDTIFGIPVVSRREDYTEADLKFFAEHPEAGGYYDLGDEETPEDGSSEGAPVQADEAGEFMRRNPTLFKHVKSFEKLRLAPYPDIGGYAIGYGAHTAEDGTPVTKDTKRIDAATAERMLARDLYARREKLTAMIPSWDYMPGAARQALLDVAMGRGDILSAERSPGLHGDLTAAGRDPAKLLAAVKKHYTTYRKSSRPKDQAGLEARRIAGMKAFFGEDYAYGD